MAVVLDWWVVPSAVRTERGGALWCRCERGTLGPRKWLLAPESRIAVVGLEGGMGFGLDEVRGKPKVFVVVNALFSLLGLVVPRRHSDLYVGVRSVSLLLLDL